VLAWVLTHLNIFRKGSNMPRGKGYGKGFKKKKKKKAKPKIKKKS
jgi:hypothetical protein